MSTSHDVSRLELSPEAMRSLGYRIVDLVVEHHRTLAGKPASAGADRATLEALLSEPPPEEPGCPDDILDTLMEHVFSNMMHPDHPRFFAFVPGPSNFVGAMADTLASGFNVITSLWMESSGPSQLELVTVDWLRRLCGLPDTAGGLFVSGGSVANLTGLAVARASVLADRVEGSVVYCSDQTHGSLGKSLKVLGFAPDQVARVPVDEAFRLDTEALAAMVSEHRAGGRRPFCVIANAGTTNTGAVDPLPALSELCRREGMWLHVDGAYGAAAVLSDRGKQALAGIDAADSLSIDPHKWLFQPFEIGCLLVRDARELRRAFSAPQEYLQDAELAESQEEVNFCELGIQLTRGFRALKLWMSLKVFGLNAVRRAVDGGIERAERAEGMLRALPCFEIVSPATLGVVCFRFVERDHPGVDLDIVNARVVEGCREDGYAVVTSTRLNSRTVLRLCTINPRTSEEDLRGTIELLARLGNESVATLK